MEIVPAPDFPTAGIIYGVSGVRDGYRTGRGRVVMRAKCHFEDIDRGQRTAIIVDEIPYQVNKKTLLERMAELVHEKKLEGISHIQDESDKSGMRVVIELKRGEVPEVVLNNLYKQTQLQDTFGINMVALIDGQPQLCNLKDLIERLPAAPPRGGHAPHRVRAAQGARARPRAGRPGGRAGQHRRIHRASSAPSPTPPVAKTELMARAGTRRWCARCSPRAGEDGTVISADAYRPEGLPSAATACSPTACTGCPTTQAQEILQMRLQRLTGLEQDKIVGEYSEVMAADRRPARHPGHAGARDDHHHRRTDGDQAASSARPSSARAAARSSTTRSDLGTEDLITPHRHGGDACRTPATSRASRCPNTARKSAAAAASRPRRPRKTTGSTSSSSPTRTTTSCASPTAAACTG